ncbi:MAG TPA: hypothetical protein VGL56_16605 [Fimbriimonadaceae bacterium]|jgi:hypothetical protein
MPEQDAIMRRMIGENPRSRPGKPAIGAKEGKIFSDIRLHMALVLRNKNPQLFRPDLFRDHLEISAEVLSALANSHSFVKARFISEEPLIGDRHLHFMAHLADSVASVGTGLCVYDLVAEEIMAADKFGDSLQVDADAARFDIHVRVIWEKSLDSGHAETKGLLKKGLPELVTEEAYPDQRVIINEVMLEGARALWNQAEIPPQVEVTAYGDIFRLLINPDRKGPMKVRILRVGRT